MHFGRVTSVEGIRFEPVPTDPRSGKVLAGSPAQEPRLYMGAPVWSVPSWKGEIYPRGTPPGRFLHYYARRFSCVELNSTFYSLPPDARLRAWRETVPEDFRFCPKVPRDASHVAPSRERDRVLDRFAESLEILGDRVGMPFLQLPPEVGPSALGRVRSLVERLPAGHRPAIEFRHPDWFSDRRLHDDAFGWLQALDLPVVISDVAGRPDVLHGSLPSPRLMVRFGGNALDPTDFERIETWADTLVRWLGTGLKEVYFFVHQPDDAHAPSLVAALEKAIDSRAPGLSVRQSPPPLPHEPDGQRLLF